MYGLPGLKYPEKPKASNNYPEYTCMNPSAKQRGCEGCQYPDAKCERNGYKLEYEGNGRWKRVRE